MMHRMNRREILKLGSTGSLAALASAVPGVKAAESQTGHAPVPQWEVFELTLSGPSKGNPFTGVQLTATVSLGHRTVVVDGFYDGSGVYKVRFMPDTMAEWTYTTSSTATALTGKARPFTSIAA